MKLELIYLAHMNKDNEMYVQLFMYIIVWALEDRIFYYENMSNNLPRGKLNALFCH